MVATIEVVGPVSFTKLPFGGSAKQLGRLAIALTEAGVRIASVDAGSGVVVRSNEFERAKSVLETFEKIDSLAQQTRLTTEGSE